MAHRRSRRDLICEAALDLAAQGGNHALTHQAIDSRLGLARGSTSYYYRTRHGLVAAAIGYLTEQSRLRFDDAIAPGPPETIKDASALVATQLAVLLTERRRDVLARYALLADAMADPELQDGLARCLFSLPAATELMATLGAPDPAGGAHNLISLLEGLVLTHTFQVVATGSDSDLVDPAESLERPLRTWISALAG